MPDDSQSAEDRIGGAQTSVETIYALSSGPPPAGVAVIRISGPQAGATLRALGVGSMPEPRRASRVTFRDPRDGTPLDDGLVLWFPAPGSYTGEDVAELHVHGGRGVVDAVLDAIAAGSGVRMAEAGEFTRRAFENGRLDLAQAEGVADLVAAETDAQRRQALSQIDGALSRTYDAWRDRLIRMLAHLEATIDFSDEDLPEGVLAGAVAELDLLIEDLERHLADRRRGEILRDGLSVVIVGAPNVGKSSLLNQIARRDAAIVSSRAGTTRDVIDVHLSVGGYPVILTDTAGLREVDPDAGDEIEAEGIRRARARAADADLTLAVFDATRPADAATLAAIGDASLVVWNKIDLATNEEDGQLPRGLPVSAGTGAGVDDLLDALSRTAGQLLATRETPVITRARHREAITQALGHLKRARHATLPELVGEDIRLAARALGRVTGQVDVEDLLDVIFRDFCIGK